MCVMLNLHLGTVRNLSCGIRDRAVQHSNHALLSTQLSALQAASFVESTASAIKVTRVEAYPRAQTPLRCLPAIARAHSMRAKKAKLGRGETGTLSTSLFPWLWSESEGKVRSRNRLEVLPRTMAPSAMLCPSRFAAKMARSAGGVEYLRPRFEL